MDTVQYEAYPVVDLAVFLPEIQLEIPELPDDVLMHYVRKAAIEFCSRSMVLERELLICTTACVPNYLLETPDDTDVISVIGAYNDVGVFNKIPTRPVNPTCRDLSVWWDKQEGSIVFTNPPSYDMRLRVRVYVSPKQDACSVDAMLYNKYREPILNGARSFLYAIPRRPWSSQPLATSYRSEFDRNIATAGVDRLLGGIQGVARIRAKRPIVGRYRI